MLSHKVGTKLTSHIIGLKYIAFVSFNCILTMTTEGNLIIVNWLEINIFTHNVDNTHIFIFIFRGTVAYTLNRKSGEAVTSM